MWEAILGKHEPVIRLLLANGAKLSAGDVGQFACFASEENSLDLLKDIVRYGGDVTVPKSDGNTTLHLAVSEGNIETVKFLVNLGADIDKLNGVGWTPRGLADQHGHEEIKDFFQSRKAWTDDIDIKTGSTSPPVGQFVGGFRAEPTICRVIDEGSQTPRDKNHGVSGQPRRKTSTFENSLFGIMSIAHGNNNSDGPLFPMSPVSRSSSANQDPRRVTICCPEKGNNCGKLVLLPGSIEELLEVGENKFNFLPTKVLSHDRAEVSGLDVIRDGDRLLLVTDEWNVEFSNNSQMGVD